MACKPWKRSGKLLHLRECGYRNGYEAKAHVVERAHGFFGWDATLWGPGLATPHLAAQNGIARTAAQAKREANAALRELAKLVVAPSASHWTDWWG